VRWVLRIWRWLANHMRRHWRPKYIVFYWIGAGVALIARLNDFAGLQCSPFVVHFTALHTNRRYIVTAKNIA
jgi:hypothetical protein